MPECIVQFCDNSRKIKKVVGHQQQQELRKGFKLQRNIEKFILTIG